MQAQLRKFLAYDGQINIKCKHFYRKVLRMGPSHKTEGRAAGGHARASKLTPEQRSAIASKAAMAKQEKSKLPTVLHKGELNLAGMTIPCAILNAGAGKDPIRVLTENGITTALLGVRSGASKRLKKRADEEGGESLPLFIAPGQLKPFVTEADLYGVLAPIQYVDGDRVVSGFDATALPVVCDIWLRAREAGALQAQQLEKAQKAEVLTRALAKVAIIALVDEATGFQSLRAKDALAEILEAFVAKELQPYLRTFPADYYEQLFRLYRLPFPPEGNKSWRPAFFGNVTNEVVYSRLAPDLLPELKKLASKAERRSRLHQWLTQDIGHPKLREHLASIVTIMKLSQTPEQFKASVNMIHPRYGETKQFDFDNPT
jgi:hypothetical protein